jgi:hypothetical protein
MYDKTIKDIKTSEPILYKNKEIKEINKEKFFDTTLFSIIENDSP